MLLKTKFVKETLKLLVTVAMVLTHVPPLVLDKEQYIAAMAPIVAHTQLGCKMRTSPATASAQTDQKL